MKQINNTLLQIQYELFGESVADLAQEYRTTPKMIEYLVEESGWERLPLAESALDWTEIRDLKEVSEELIEEVEKRMTILQTVKQSTLNPKYIALESAIIGKSLEVIQTIDATNPLAHTQLKIVSEILKSLKEQNATIQKVKDAKTDQKAMKVEIISQVGDGPTKVKSGVAVQIKQEDSSE